MTSLAWQHTSTAQQLHFRWGARADVGKVLHDSGARRALLVTTAGRLDSDDGRRLVEVLGRALVSTYAGARQHLPTNAVEEAVRQARRDGVDAVVSFGGGSCADLGKAVCYFTEQEQGTPGSSYLDRPAIAHVSVPTTYSGAEVTPFFAMTDAHTRRSAVAGGPTLAPLAVVYDPELTLSVPARVSAETGMSALAHCVECAYSTSRSPEAEAIALAGAARVVAALPAVVEDPTDRDARARMLEAAALGGRCVLNASMGAERGLAQLLGGRTGIAHGLANALLLPHVIRFNRDTVPHDVQRVGRVLGDATDPAGAVEAFVRRLDLPGRLSDCGVEHEDLAAVARQAESNPSIRRNPRTVSAADALAILEAAF